MDVKRMHEMIEKLSECAKAQFDKGIDKVDICEMSKAVDMMKDLSEAMYYRELTKTMQEYDPDESMEMLERYGDGGRRFYDHYRYADGRFAPKGRGTYRRGYISIHAPTRGATNSSMCHFSFSLFQSTLPRGERL